MTWFIVLTCLCFLAQTITYFCSLYQYIDQGTNKRSYLWVKDRRKAIAMMIPWGFIYVLYRLVLENTEF